MQPTYVYGWEGYFRCRSCTLREGQDGLRQQAAGTYRGLGPIEEHTCDRCRRYAGNNLTPTILRFNMLVIFVALCPRCEKWLIEQGAVVLENN
jgi:hypothetical protein